MLDRERKNLIHQKSKATRVEEFLNLFDVYSSETNRQNKTKMFGETTTTFYFTTPTQGDIFTRAEKLRKERARHRESFKCTFLENELERWLLGQKERKKKRETVSERNREKGKEEQVSH